MPIKVTRALLTAALDGSLTQREFRTDPYFGFAVPTSVPGVEPHLLYPIKTWTDKAEFDETARKLVGMFQKNFAKFEEQVDADVRAAAPDRRSRRNDRQLSSPRDAGTHTPRPRGSRSAGHLPYTVSAQDWLCVPALAQGRRKMTPVVAFTYYPETPRCSASDGR